MDTATMDAATAGNPGAAGNPGIAGDAVVARDAGVVGDAGVVRDARVAADARVADDERGAETICAMRAGSCQNPTVACPLGTESLGRSLCGSSGARCCRELCDFTQSCTPPNVCSASGACVPPGACDHPDDCSLPETCVGGECALARTCSNVAGTYQVLCVGWDELADPHAWSWSAALILRGDAGVEALGRPNAFRCPDVEELTVDVTGEAVGLQPICGPDASLETTLEAFAGDAGNEPRCCYGATVVAGV